MSRSRSPQKGRTTLEASALESLVAKKLEKWLKPESDEVQLLSQFCAAIVHSEENWKKEVREEVLPFLNEVDTNDFLEWFEKSRWKDEAYNKFGKAALRLKERALQEASGNLPPPEFKAKGPKDLKRTLRTLKPAPARSMVANDRLSGYPPGNYDPLGYGPLTAESCSFIPPTSCSSYAMPVNPASSGRRPRATLTSHPPNALEGIPCSSMPLHVPSIPSMPLHVPSAPAMRRELIPTVPDQIKTVSMAYGNYDYSKSEYQNMTLGAEPTKDKVEDRKAILINRRSMLERQTKMLQGLLTKLNDPNCDAKQREKLVSLVGKLKAQMQVVKKAEPPRL